jgi:hypothetical protein
MPFPLDRQWVTRTEQLLGVRFPLSFVARMMRENGGEISTDADHWFLFPFRDETDRKRLSRTTSDIIHETKSAHEWPGFPTGAVAIATNGGGDLLVLLPDDNEPAALRPEVYWWDHETGDIEKVADDFEEVDDESRD